jgi:acyl carrier protein
MDETVISTKIKDIIAKVAGLNGTRIPDGASLREDLSLDSLSLLEIAVEVDYSFKLGLPDERYKGIAALPDMVALVRERLAELAGGPQAVEG